MAAGKPLPDLHSKPQDPAQAEETEEKQDVFHPDDPAVTESRLSALVENTHVSGDLKVEKLTYIHEMLVELRKLAASVGEPMVSYLIDMALVETASALQTGRFNEEFKAPESD
ncbi:hypothetical protein [Salaquimonas pukyongi]|uniref:hypothetical protein n=1 Tax=Salaquimonas pukyongi TaxID=2712698 RepID=UPI00096BBC92|nr:hypothetical protein [Salaquimonas pukyongi]